jgi:hypothetical protein
MAGDVLCELPVSHDGCIFGLVMTAWLVPAPAKARTRTMTMSATA